jgi:hypothetical protein
MLSLMTLECEYWQYFWAFICADGYHLDFFSFRRGRGFGVPGMGDGENENEGSGANHLGASV